MFAEQNNCNATTCEILLILDVLVGRENYVESSLLRTSNQFAILQTAPAFLSCGPNLAVGKKGAQWNGSALIEENAFHGAKVGGLSRLRAAKLITDFT